MSPFQCFQSVKVNDETSPHHGRAGSVRSDARKVGTGKAAQDVVTVALDAAPGVEAAEVEIPLSALVAL